MEEKVSRLLEKYLGMQLNEYERQLIDMHCTYRSFHKEAIVLFQGEEMTHLYFIRRGLVRAYYLDEEGNDMTKSFAAENDFFSTKGLLTNGHSLFNVACLEDCECIQIPYSILKQLMADNEELFKLFNQYIITALEGLELRARDLVMKSAEERYRIFLQQYAKLEQRISQKYIASYIGIRIGSLSRIKKQIRLKD